MKTHSKLIIWPRRALPGPQGEVYRYVVVGMICTDEPIQALEGVVECVLDEASPELVDFLERARQRQAKRRLGDASDVLLSLNEV
jgi:hypothetical protein